MRRVPILPALLFSSALSSTTAHAQKQFSSAVREHVPLLSGGMSAAAFADFDRDGDQDLVLVGQAGIRFWLNDGQGRLTDDTATRLPPLSSRFRTLLTLDADRDGDLDISLLGDVSQCRLLLNDGSGRFLDATATHLPVLVEDATSAAAGDVDRDGDLDIVIGLNGSRQNRLWLNDGSGRFTDGTFGRLPPPLTTTRGLFLADLDGDADLDLVLGDIYTGAKVWTNDGSGRFTDTTLVALPLPPISGWIAVEDVDRDGDPDLWIGGFAPSGDRLLINDGTGRFADETTSRLPAQTAPSQFICLRDLDGDGAVDAYLGKAVAGDRIWRNDGSGRFTDVTVTHLPANPMTTNAFAAGDADRDGDVDLVLGAYSGQPWILFNDGTGRLVNGMPARLPAKREESDHTTAIGIGDLDGDGCLDAVLSLERRFSPRPYLVFLRNDGSGVLRDESHRLPFTIPQLATTLATGDLDGDGDLDLVAAIWYGEARIFRNDGTGYFTEPNPIALPWMTASDVKLVDVEGDGDLDLLFGGGFSQAPRLFLNDRRGNFTEGGATQVPYVLGRRLAVGDIDGDGDTDIVMTEADARNHVLINDGRGFFTDESAARLPATMDDPYPVALADVDGDGDLDLAIGNMGRNQDRLYLNDGRGFFADVTATHLPPDQDTTFNLAFGDLDDDGRPDLVVASDQRSRILLNDGSGRFRDVTAGRLADVVTASRVVALADFSGSGVPDVFIGREGPDLLCSNRLHSVVGPLLPRVGGGYEFDFYVRPGFASGGELMWACLSPRLSPSPIVVPPLGSWGLEPARMMTLAWVAIPATSGFVSLRVAIPPDLGLVGLRFFVQGLVFRPPGATPWSFTNVLADWIR